MNLDLNHLDTCIYFYIISYDKKLNLIKKLGKCQFLMYPIIPVRDSSLKYATSNMTKKQVIVELKNWVYPIIPVRDSSLKYATSNMTKKPVIVELKVGDFKRQDEFDRMLLSNETKFITLTLPLFR